MCLIKQMAERMPMAGMAKSAILPKLLDNEQSKPKRINAQPAQSSLLSAPSATQPAKPDAGAFYLPSAP